MHLFFSQLTEKTPFMSGDSVPEQKRERLSAFIEKLKSAIAGDMLDYHFILDDPAGNSYLEVNKQEACLPI